MKPELLDGYYTAQISVIGSMLIDDRCIPLVLSKMAPDDFTDGTCKATFRAIQKLILAGRPADPVTVLDAMQGGDAYARWIKETMELTPTAANVEAYIGIAKDGAAFAALRAGADMILNGCASLDEAREQLRKMAGAVSATNRMQHMTAQDLAADFWTRLQSKKKPDYLPWGIPTADDKIYSERGDLIILGGYSSAGKTLLSAQMALAQAKRYKVGYYSLETQPEKMADRIFAHLASVSLTDIKRRTMDASDFAKISTAMTDFVANCPVEFIRAGGSTVEDITSDAIANGFEIIYIDYLQLIMGDGRETDYQRVSRISRELKTFAQNSNTAVVALAQLHRSEKTKDGKYIPPDMHSFRDSGQIEQDADVAYLLWASDPNDNASHRIFKAGKNKEGSRFVVELDFDGATQTMVERMESPAAYYSRIGREAKQTRRALAAMAGQTAMTEVSESDTENPFEEV